ncbi:hypothetical protein SRABI36_00180 [Pedobacter sp. Bi36]|nr:hypothetical protein SRABI36_00180 [Pedobacter sp. Bi36]CAH0181668.1 hypothetical protein SRABI126_01275 [Pedobacter sp. Bi126]
MVILWNDAHGHANGLRLRKTKSTLRLFQFQIVMERKITWEGLKYKSLENCTLTETDNGVTVTSIITGQVNNQVIKVSYKILTDPLWTTYLVEINVILGGNEKTVLLEKKGAYWLVNNTIDHRFDGCVDIDISLTPFTNTLPIRRLVFNGQLSNRIEVIYIDIIADMIMPVRQYYTKISDSVYLYENEKSTFKAELKTDSYGLVIEYPKLFREK